MVRKRSKGAKRYFDSEDEPETESDFEDDPVYKPQAKKYSLRQRKKPTFNSDDYEYEEDMFDAPPRKEPSDDEDFDLKNKEQTNSTENKTECSEKSEDVDESVNTAKPSDEEAATEQEQDELVDFEDMIRADIVMNKNRIDYDNVIQKTEIKIQPLPVSERAAVERKRQKQPPVVKPKGKRGRKPKRRNSDIELDEPQFLAPQIQENENDEDYHPYKPKRTRKPKTRPAGEVDSSILDDFDDYDFEDHNDVDYNPDDDLDYPGLSGLSNYILDKQISEDFENNVEHTQNTLEQPVNSLKEVDNPETFIESSSKTILDTTAPVTTLENLSQDAEAVSASEPSQQEKSNELDTTSRVPVEDTSVAPIQDTSSAEPVQDKSSMVPVEDASSGNPLQETSDSAQTESSPANNITEDTNNADDDDDGEDDGVPRQLNEISGAFEKITSASYASVIRVNETVVNNSDLYVNGNAKHIENPEVNIMDCKEEVESEDDDIVFIEDERKCEVIVLDD